jgi:glycerophosphoryl diester phosphodiesterase
MHTDPSRSIIFAHRGASAHAPENTMAAFALAIQQDADAIELDAKLSADGHVIVIHDPSVERTTDGQGEVRFMTLSVLQELDAGSFFDVAYQGERIPTLDQVFEAFGHKTFINVELTNYKTPNDDLPDRVASLIRRHKLEKRILFSSFNPRALRRVMQIIPEIPIALLASAGRSGWWARSWLGRMIVPYEALHPELTDVTPELVAATHRRGHKLNVYTVNRAEDMQRLFKMQVDGIFTDDPRLAHKIFKESRLSTGSR